MVAQVSYQRVGEILRDERLLDRLAVRAQRIADKAGPGFVVEKWVGVHRVRATVVAETPEAIRESAVNHVLLKAIDAGRG